MNRVTKWLLQAKGFDVKHSEADYPNEPIIFAITVVYLLSPYLSRRSTLDPQNAKLLREYIFNE